MIHGINLRRHLDKTFKIKVFNESIHIHKLLVYNLYNDGVMFKNIFFLNLVNKERQKIKANKNATPLSSSFCPENTKILKVMMLKKNKSFLIWYRLCTNLYRII